MYNVNIHANYSTGLKQEAIDLEIMNHQGSYGL